MSPIDLFPTLIFLSLLALLSLGLNVYQGFKNRNLQARLDARRTS